MHRRWPALLASASALAIIGATAWSLFRDVGARGGDPFEGATRTAQARSDGSDRLPSPAAPQRIAEADEADEEEAPALANGLEEALAQAGIVADPGAAGGLEIAVVDRVSRAPRADVPVLVFAGDRPNATRIWKGRLDPKWLRKEHAGARRSDPDGKIRVALPTRGALLVADAGEARGVLFVPSGTTEATLELGAPLELAVHVVDGEGAARAGVAVAIVKRGRSVGTESAARAVSDAAGVALLRDLDLALNGRATTSQWRVAFAVPTGTATGRDVDLADAAQRQVELVLPPTGTLALQVVATAGAPLAAAGRAELVAHRVRRSSGATTSHHHDESFTVPIAADGTATVEPIGLDLHFTIEAHLAGRRAAKVEADGPVHAEQRVTIEVPAGATGPVVTGRARDGEGAPVAGVDLVAELVPRGEPHADPVRTTSRSRTDDDGRFAFDLGEADPGALALPATLSIARHAAHGAPAAGARIDFSGGAGSVDVGDVVLADLPLLAAGHVVDDRDEPVAGATVELVADDGDPRAAEPGPTVRGRTHTDGRFELRGAAPDAPGRLAVSERGYARTPPVGFESGATDLRLVLPRAGVIVGSLALPENVSSRLFHVALLGPDGGDGAATADAGESAHVGHAGGFRFDGLSPGSFAVRIALLDAAKEPATRLDVGPIEVRAGETTRDERLAAVDVAGLLRLLVVDVHDEEGGAVAAGTVAAVAGTALPRVEARLRDGHAVLAAPAEAFDLEVLAPGFRPARVAARPGTLALVLMRGLRVHLVAPLDHPRDANLVLGRVKLVPAGAADAKEAPATSALIGPSGEADVVVPLVGKYVAVLEYRKRDAAEKEGRRAWSGSLEVACEVLDRPETQTLRLAPPP